jgi:hypothetical protein
VQLYSQHHLTRRRDTTALAQRQGAGACQTSWYVELDMCERVWVVDLREEEMAEACMCQVRLAVVEALSWR